MLINYGLQDWGTASFVLRDTALLGAANKISMEPSCGKGREEAIYMERKLPIYRRNGNLDQFSSLEYASVLLLHL